MLSQSVPFDSKATTEAPPSTEINAGVPSLELTQPPVTQPMNTQVSHDESDDASLRGGRSEMCPGRFCFIIPCPIPCDFCII